MKHIDIVFDLPPGPDLPCLIEIENDEGKSMRVGNWVRRVDGYYVLRITPEHLKGILHYGEIAGVIEMLCLTGELGGKGKDETYAQYLRRLLDFIAKNDNADDA